jgi:hypothetical protein
MRRPIHFTTSVSGDVAAMAQHLAEDPRLWLPDLVTSNGSARHRVRLSTGDLLAVPDVVAVVTVGEATSPSPRLTIRELGWRAEAADSLFPVLVADLELLTTGPATGELRLVGSYRAPLSVIGAAADRLVGRHVASEVIRSFVLKVAQRLDAWDSTSALPSVN